MRTAVDTSVLLDVLGGDPTHGRRSRDALQTAYDGGALLACDVVWAEVRAHFPSDAGFDEALRTLGVRYDPLSTPRVPTMISGRRSPSRSASAAPLAPEMGNGQPATMLPS